MPPRRRPRSWLAGRLRSAAGAVQRLAGRFEPADHLPPPPQTPAATPRRFGEPPQHWLDLVAAHAPGLLHDLDLDPPGAGNAEAGARSDGRGESTGQVDADGADPVADARTGRLGGLGRLDSGAGVGGPGASGDKGPTRSRAESRTGGPGRPSRAGDQPDGTAAGPFGDGTPSSSSDLTTPSAGSTWPDASTPPTGSTRPPGPGAAMPPVRRAAGGDTTAIDTTTVDTTTVDTTALDTTAVDAGGLPRADGPRQPVRSMVFGPHSSPIGRPHPAEAEATRTTSRPPLDALRSGEVDRWRSPESLPVRPGGRDGFRGDSADGRVRSGENQSGHVRGDAPSAARTSRGDTGAVHRPLDRPARGGAGESWTGSTATKAGDPSTSVRGDVDRLVDGGPWLALPGESAPPGRPVALRDGGTGTAGGGRTTGIDGPPPSAAARSVDPWPALPDDTALWSVAGAAVDTAQLTRLDREQAGD
ncbi:hypothetical protein [Micromonospora sp. NPDC005324]|uniref:hypothetical protein n=1 Tax=Micromonospora sp. NPDC005324 TaxID=3157033 RepID=UPI0033A35278